VNRGMPNRCPLWAAILGAAACLATGLDAGAAESKKAEPKFGSGAEGVNTTTGRVISTASQSVELKSDTTQVTFYATKTSKAILAIVGQLAPSDNVTITWTQKDGRKWIQKIEGRDTVEGLVTARTDLGIVVKPDNGDPQNLLFPWAGVPKEDVAKLDQKALKRASQAKVGDRVRGTWEISDAKRMVDVKYLAKAPGNKSSSNAAGQRSSENHTPSVNGLLRRARHMSGH
jgi:hypothetical protein